MKKAPTCAVIIVTHNSESYLPICLRALHEQTVKLNQIIVIDSGSSDMNYLFTEYNIFLNIQKSNVGFCKGNNIGYSYINPGTDYILFLNPDAFLSKDFIERAMDKMEEPSSANVGALSGQLLGYDIARHAPTGLVDTTGIFSTWYGRWYDRGQGKPNGHYTDDESIPALCGALMFCRKKALDSILLGNDEVMDPEFFMYKEDIDLSLRLRKKGWKLLFCPALTSYHCRGWQHDRSKVPLHLRLLSAKNEMRLYRRMKSPKYFYSLFKYTLVKCFNI